MKSDALAEIHWPQLSEIIAQTTGLHFPPDRRADLQRGLTGAAEEFGFADALPCAQWLMSVTLTKPQVQVLASHLTVGETYFFREQSAFDALAGNILPELVRSRRGREQRLRLWSAACCTGEEPYSLAILLHQRIPDLPDWRVTILATDINGRYLEKAAAGVYGEWSFRESPAWLKERYFRRVAEGRYAIRPEIRKLVTFAPLNLAEDNFPPPTADTNAMDVVFCRNLLMYFTLPQARRVVRNLRHSLVEQGWLVVSSSEGAHALSARFAPVSFPGVILYQKSDVPDRSEPSQMSAPLGEAMEFFTPPHEAILPWMPQTPSAPPLEALIALPTEERATVELPAGPHAAAAALYEQGRYAEAVDTLLASAAIQVAPDPPAFSLLARALANQGKLDEARGWCERWIAADKLDASGHYLRALVLQELGDREQARCSLQRTIYLRPGFVLAHFALGSLARVSGKTSEADKHLANALDLLRRCAPDDPLPESNGLRAGRLTEIITSLITPETGP